MDPPPAPSPGPEAPALVTPAIATTEPPYHHAIRLAYPEIAKLAQHGRYAEIATACGSLEIMVFDDSDPIQLLVTAPLVLASLMLDDTPSAYYGLRRLPDAIAGLPLPQALFPLVASISERKYHNIQARIVPVINLARGGGPLGPEFAILVEMMATSLQSTWRQRMFELLSRAYSAIPAAQASAFLHLPTEKIISELPSWTFDAPTNTFIPKPSGANGKPVSLPSSLSRFDDAVGGAAHLESVF